MENMWEFGEELKYSTVHLGTKFVMIISQSKMQKYFVDHLAFLIKDHYLLMLNRYLIISRLILF